MSVDWLEPAYVLKELVDIPAGVHRKEKVSFQPDETLDTGQETSTGSSIRQGTTTPSGRRENFTDNEYSNTSALFVQKKKKGENKKRKGERGSSQQSN
ncbi:hypothetical protein NPIL_545391 [Nephila pilipes]|uniref:Uncharacterized protein n=1 Tax=Nephila pilipes TaxID=299642 RepID=A0A8X6JK56_NEPPI|nr:hypothetical protein NPIL_545391 [Nephila pilipes]